MKFVLAGDSGPTVGLGHRRRLEAVGDVLRSRGHDAAFVAVDDAPVPPGDVLVVDSYRTRADDRARYPGPLVAAIDELGRDLGVEIVIDPTPGATWPAGAHAQRGFAGAGYAIVASEFAQPPRPPRPQPQRVLVTLGASAAGAAARPLANALADRYPVLRVQAAVGPWLDTEPLPGVEFVSAPDGLVDVIRDADIVITAGGVTLLESCASARPTVVVPLAHNQRNAVAFLARLGAARACELDEVPDVLGELLADEVGRDRLGRTARATIDGAGATRVAGALIELAENGR